MSTLNQMQFPGMPERTFEDDERAFDKENERNYAERVGPDRARFSHVPGQRVMDLEGTHLLRMTQGNRLGFPASVQPSPPMRGQIMRTQEAAGEVDKFGFIADPTLPTEIFDAHGGRDLEMVGPVAKHLQYKTLGPDHALHTRQMVPETERTGSQGGDIKALREVDEFRSLPSVIRYGGKDIPIDGHHRIAAARTRGTGEVKVNYFDFDKHGPQASNNGRNSFVLPPTDAPKSKYVPSTAWEMANEHAIRASGDRRRAATTARLTRDA